MAPNAELEHLLQAYIDGELSPSERVLVEKQIHECPESRALLARQRACAAELFETFRDHRLKHDLTPYIVDHLPDMAQQIKDVRTVNRRAKNPSPFLAGVGRFIPVYAAIVIVALAYVMTRFWPETPIPAGAIGIVTYSDGMVERVGNGSFRHEDAPVSTPCMDDDVFVTGDDGRMILTLADATRIHVAPETRYRVMEDRTVSLEKGRMLLRVNRGKQLFRVLTEHGVVTVYGTTFEVSVDSMGATVVVAEGEVTLTHLLNRGVFATLNANQLGRLSSTSELIVTESVDAWSRLAWADAFVPDRSVEAKFFEEFGIEEFEKVVAGRSTFYAPTVDSQGNPARVGAVTLSWPATTRGTSRCSYDVLVKKDGEIPLFQARIPAETFSDPDRTTITLRHEGDSSSLC